MAARVFKFSLETRRLGFLGWKMAIAQRKQGRGQIVEAVERANETQFGLGCTILTKSRSRARRLSKAVRCGNVSINDFGFTYMAMDLPFGGTGGSGFGRLNGRDGIRACTNPKAVLVDRFPMHQPSKLYPVGPKDYDLARGVIRTLYGRGVKGKLRGLGDLAKTLIGRR